MHLRLLIIPLLAVVVLAGCSTPKQNNQVTATYEEFTPKEAIAIIETLKHNPNFILLDVRTPSEFESGHIAGAVVLNFRSPAFTDSLKQLDKSKTYMLYCRSGNRSSQAVAQMKSMHFQTIYHINGGINQWKAAGLPVEQ